VELPDRLVECVPNFSEGRDPAVVAAIAGAAAGVRGIRILDLQRDIDHNRFVLTFVGPPETVGEAAVAAAGLAARHIDLTRHGGVHPRIGAADVIPFIPLRGVTLEECAVIARSAGEQHWRRNGVPVYLYAAAALRADRTRLEQIRKGGFNVLREAALTDPYRRPDIGGPALHPTAGASIFGARKFLVAYNVNLQTGATRDSLSNPAEIGTYLLEFGKLTQYTGDSAYYKTAKKASFEVFKRRSKIGLVGTVINVNTGAWVNTESQIGARIDSYYEYLFKAWLLFGDQDCKAAWQISNDAIIKYLYKKNRQRGILYPG